jgi:hypothetical protein
MIVLQNVHTLFPGLQAYSLLTTLMRTISLSRDRGTQTDPSLPSEWHGIMLRGTQTLLASLKGSFFNHKSTFLDICAESGRFQSFGARLEMARAHGMLPEADVLTAALPLWLQLCFRPMSLRRPSLMRCCSSWVAHPA